MPWFAGLLFITIGPIAASLVLGFTEYNLIQPPQFNGLRNFTRMLDDTRLHHALGVTFRYVAVSVPLQPACALGLAPLLDKGLRGLTLYRSAFYLPSLLGSSVAIAVLWQQIFGTDGLMNQVLAMVGVQGRGWISDPATALSTLIVLNVWTSGAPMIIFLAGLRQIPQMYYEAAATEESRALTAVVLDESAWVLVFDTAMTNVSGSTLDFGAPTTKGRPNAGYGGLFWRGPRSFTGGIVQSPIRAGGDDLRGERFPWLGFRGRHDETGDWSTIVMVDDDTNPQHPPLWFTRTEDFACLCPAPFFDQETSVPHGTTIRFRYAVVVASGDHGEAGTKDLAEQGRSVLSRV